MENKKLKVAVVGCGSIASFHIKAYEQLPNVEVYAFCDINPDALKAKGEWHHVTRLYTDEDLMLKECPEIDAVSVCTWNNGHAECTIKALNAGKHVICEKPMAMTVEEAERMKEAADRNGKLLMIGFVRRYGNDCIVAKDLVDSGVFGELYYAKVNYLRRHGNPGGWFCDISRSGGGCLIDLGVHVIDYARYLMGCPKPVSVYGSTFKKLGNRPEIKAKPSYVPASAATTVCDVEDLAVGMVRFDNGATLTVETSFCINGEGKNSIELYGTKAGARIDGKFEIFSDTNGYLTNTSFANNGMATFDFEKSFFAEISHFVDCIINNKPCISTAEDGIYLMKILRGIYESAQTGHEVLL